jgi:hypothetical protein
MMQSRYVVKIIFLFLFLSLNLFAIDGKIRVYVPKQDDIYISQKMTVAVELLSNAFSITDAKIIFPPSESYIVQAPQSASYLNQEEIDNESWQMVHYEYEIYALKGGRIEIPSAEVSFTVSMGYGQPKKEFNLKSDVLSFDVKVPEGVGKDQFVLVTDNFKLITEVKPEKQKLTVGDAVELHVTQRAHDVPDLLLTPITYSSNALLRVYGKEPLLESGLKGDYDVARTDQFTFIAGMEGNVTLPKQEIVWYNASTKKLHVEKIPAMKFEILPDPQIAIDAKRAEQKEFLIYISSVLLSMVILYFIFASKIENYRKNRRELYAQSEAGKFDVLLSNIGSGDLRLIDRQFYLWLLSAAPELARGGIKSIEMIQPTFAEVLKMLDLKMVNSNIDFDRVKFSNELKTFRKKLLQEQKSIREGLPVTINP